MDLTCRIVQVDNLDVHLWLASAFDAPQLECEKAFETIAKHTRDFGPERLGQQRMLAISDGGAPNAQRRRRLFREILRDIPIPSSVITTSLRSNPVKRGIATALQWMNPRFRMFEPEQVSDALDHLGLGRAAIQPLWRQLSSMQRSLAPNAAMAQIARHLGLPMAEVLPNTKEALSA